jgi:hypothetical protein
MQSSAPLVLLAALLALIGGPQGPPDRQFPAPIAKARRELDLLHPDYRR